MRQEESGSSHALEGAEQLTAGDTIRVCWRIRGGARGIGGNGSRGKQQQAAAKEKDAAALKANCSSGGSSDDWDLCKMQAAASAKQSRSTRMTSNKIRKTKPKQHIHMEHHLDHLVLEGIYGRQSRLDRSATQRRI